MRTREESMDWWKIDSMEEKELLQEILRAQFETNKLLREILKKIPETSLKDVPR